MRRIIATLSLALFFIIGLSASSQAQGVNDFTITDFHAEETLTRNDTQGELHVVETIKVDFSGQNHGIVRAIPGRYKGNTLKLHMNRITSETGASTKYSETHTNGNIVFKIGDADRTVTGNQEYTLDYTLQNVISFTADHAELYWDVNGDQWQQPFTRVSATVHLPADVPTTDGQPTCYAGSYGSTDQNCTINLNGHILQIDASDLRASQTLTYVVGFQNGYFRPATWLDKLADYAASIIAVLVPVIVAAIIGFAWWLRSGRDAKGRGTIVPEYSVPAGLSPLKSDVILRFRPGDTALTATIIDLARRGYLKIIEIRQDRLIGKDKLSYNLQLKRTDLAGLDSQETELLQALFAEITLDSVIALDDLKAKLFKTAQNIKKTAVLDAAQGGYLKKDPSRFGKIASGLFVVGFIILWVGLLVFHSVAAWPLLFGIIAGGVILGAFVKALPARTAKGVAAKEQLLGLKLYMEMAEKDRLQKLEGPDAAYAANAGAPERTVELFEKLLPYAIVMGVEKGWANQFKDIYTSPPDWYSGNWTSFNAGLLVGSLNGGFAGAVSGGFSAPSSSSSSGFGGGGFSGGGGGGGGGGGW